MPSSFADRVPLGEQQRGLGALVIADRGQPAGHQARPRIRWGTETGATSVTSITAARSSSWACAAARATEESPGTSNSTSPSGVTVGRPAPRGRLVGILDPGDAQGRHTMRLDECSYALSRRGPLGVFHGTRLTRLGAVCAGRGIPGRNMRSPRAKVSLT